MHLRKEGTDGKGSDQAAVLHWVAEADGRHRGDKGRETRRWRKTTPDQETH